MTTLTKPSGSVRNFARANPEHWAKALEVATWVIQADRALMGAPRIRRYLIDCAARRAVGFREAQPDRIIYDLAHPETLDVAFRVLAEAVDKATDAVAACGPVRRGKA